jgi:hypothetical protein
MKKALIVADFDVSNNQRVKRQISFIENEYAVTTVVLKSSPKTKEKLFYFSRLYDKYYWDEKKVCLLNQFKDKEYDIVIANNIESLPFAIKISYNSLIIFDAHEYHPEEFNDNLFWRIFHKPYLKYLCKKYIKYCDLFTTVSQTIANKYMGLYNKEVYTITNAAQYFNLSPYQTIRKIKIIHHGAAIRSRRLEDMIDMAMMLEKRFEVYFMLTGGENYINQLKRYASKNKSIYFIPPVNSEKIIEYTNIYDIAIYILSPRNFNHINALPNKLFEFIQARLCLVVTPNLEMKNIVEKFRVGRVCSDYSPKTMAKTINSMSIEQIMNYKRACDYAAKKHNFQKNKDIFLALIKDIENN